MSLPLSTDASEWYVAANGSATGDGSRERPWDLATALAHPPAVKPGDTIWLRGGNYKLAECVTRLTGSPEKHIVVRQFPDERAIIDENSPILALNQFHQ